MPKKCPIRERSWCWLATLVAAEAYRLNVSRWMPAEAMMRKKNEEKEMIN